MRHRTSQQREVILDELRGFATHPTAQELYEAVRRRLPHISLGTVYRNLDLLAREGQARRLDYWHGQARYDGRLEEHQHVHCESCGRLGDVDVPGEAWRSLVPVCGGGFEITKCRIEFSGVCGDCAAARNGSIASL
jgi:Fur family ferric uptake transcriptional regulator